MAGFSSRVRSYLHRVLTSVSFSSSPGLCDLLRYIVIETLEGRGAEIKEYSIGVDVLRRGPRFDPRLDPVVRVQFRRLRSKLQEYYAMEGASDAIRLELPKRRYTPFFRELDPPSDLRQPAPDTAVSLAVLPFVNLSSTPDNTFFAEGLTEELIHHLTRRTDLRIIVMPSTSVGKPSRESISATNASLVLTGSVRQFGTKIRVSVQLVRVHDAAYLWSEIFEREPRDIFLVQQDISSAITNTLSLRPSLLIRIRTHSKKAHDLALEAVHYRRARRAYELRRCIQLFHAAVDADPEYASAHLGMAEAYVEQAFFADARPSHVMPLAENEARRALLLDATLVESYACLGIVAAVFHQNSAAAADYFDRVRDLAPNYYLGWEWRVRACELTKGSLVQAAEDMARARDLDPISPGIHSMLAYIHHASGDPHAALSDLQQTLELHPDAYLAHWVLGLIQEQRGDIDNAVRSFELARDLSGGVGFVTASLAHALAGSDRERAIAILMEMKTAAKRAYFPSLDMAVTYIALGDMEESRRCLAAAYEERSPWIPHLRIDPRARRLAPYFRKN